MQPIIPFPRESVFPKLRRSCYAKTSDETGLNNCAAWAVGYTRRWMQPKTEPWHFWPDGAPNNIRVESFVQAFELLGFQLCGDDSLEEGFDKIAVYATA